MSVIQTTISGFSVLRNRNFRIYLGGQAVSLIGTWLQVTAQGWVIWKLTGSTIDLGVTTMLSSLPMLLLAPWAGSWADRFDRRKILIATQVVAMLLAFILAILVLTNVVQRWHIFALSLALGVVTAIDLPTQQTFLGDLSGKSEVRKAINLNIMILQVSRMLGPAIAGLIVGVLERADPEGRGNMVGWAFVLNGLSFIAVIISLMIVRVVKTQSEPPKNQNALQGFGEAVAFIRSQPRLQDLILFAIFLTFFGFSIVMNLLPAVATDVLYGDPSTLGAMMSASGAGALIGAMVVAPWVQSLRRTGFALALAMMCAASAFFLLGVSNVLPLAMAGLFIAGLAAPAIMTTAMGLLQVNAPPNMRARVMSLFTMVSFGFQPLASLWIGWIADKEHLGIQRAILLNAAGLLVGGIFMFSRSALRNWESNRPAETPIAKGSEVEVAVSGD